MPATAPPPVGDPGSQAPVRHAATAVLERGPEADARWREVVAATNLRKRMLGAFLEESRFVGLAEGKIVIAMDDLHRTVVDEKENRAIVMAEIGRAFGSALELRCAPLAEAGLEPASPTDDRPLVDQAIAWFQGDPIERPTPKRERTSG